MVAMCPSCASSQTTYADIEVETAGAAASFAPVQCGGVAFVFSGRVGRLDEFGRIFPVAGATFSYPATDGSITALPIAVETDGRFQEAFSAMGSTYTLERSGLELTANAPEYRLRLYLEAPGCTGTDVPVGVTWEDQDVVLRCPEPH
jgi:hypothetical protein